MKRQSTKMRQNSWLCLPKQQTATKTFCAVKIFLQIVFFACFIFQTFLTVYYLKYYRDRVEDIKVSSVFPSRSEMQVETTHSHFFLFTGLMNGAAIAVGIWGIWMEYLIVLAAYGYIHSVIIGFELIGCWQSYNLEILKQKGVGVLTEVPLVILALIFAHMVREAERQLANDPLYKKKMAQRAGKGETMCDPNYVIPEKKGKNTKETRLSGMDNPALDMTDEGVVVNQQPSGTSTSNNTSRSVSIELNEEEAEAFATPPETLPGLEGHKKENPRQVGGDDESPTNVSVSTTNGRTKINVTSEKLGAQEKDSNGVKISIDEVDPPSTETQDVTLSMDKEED